MEPKLTNYRILASGSCHNAQFKLVALVEGHLQIVAVRVTDADTKNFVDVKTLPDIIAEQKSEE